MTVTISGPARRIGLRRRELATRARRVLEALDLADRELSILLVDDAAIHELNAAWRDRDRPTDVLSFSLLEGDQVLEGGALGDVVISLETAHRQAEERDATLGEEVDRLLVHGILHLIGYDHEISPAEERRMKRKENALLARLA